MRICDISSSCSFAVGFDDGSVKIYSRNEKTHAYELKRQFKDHSVEIFCFLYMPKHDLLLSGSGDSTIYLYELAKGEKYIDSLTANGCSYESLISISRISLQVVIYLYLMKVLKEYLFGSSRI